MYGRLCLDLSGNQCCPQNGYTRSSMQWMDVFTNTRRDLWLEGSPRKREKITFASITRYTTIRSITSNVKTVFLNGVIEEEVYIEQP